MRSGATSSSVTIAKFVGFQEMIVAVAEDVLGRDREPPA